MKINRQNYENHLIDYIEGRLNYLEHESMRVFLINNPDIAEEIEEIKEINISENDLSIIGKSTLYKNFSFITEINERNFEELCVAFLEGDLNEATKARLSNYIGEDKVRDRIFKVYQSLNFKPDSSIRFQSKNQLKKHTIPLYRKYVLYAASIAAAIALAIILNLNQNKKDVTEITGGDIAVSNNNAVINSFDIKLENLQLRKIENKKARSNYREIAAVDTNNQKKADYIKLTAITPLGAEISTTSKEVMEMTNSSDLLSHNDDMKSSKPENDATLAKQSNKNTNQEGNFIVKALKLGIKGISDLTESDIALSTQTDDEGNLSAFAISAGEFELARKLSSKSQKN